MRTLRSTSFRTPAPLVALLLCAACSGDASRALVAPVAEAGATVTVVIASPPATLEVGDTATVVAQLVNPGKGKPSASLRWSSSDPAVATVDQNGGITAVAPGTTTIRAQVGNGAGSPFAEFVLTVRAGEGGPTVTVTPSTATVLVGAEADFDAVVLPAGAVAWSVADASIAEHLGDGTFRALAAGETQVTATVVGHPGVSASATLRVDAVDPGDGTKVWAGGDPSGPRDWHVAANWRPVGVPTGTDDVLVPAAPPNQPRLGAAALVHDLTTEPGATLEIGGFLLTVGRNLTAGGEVIGAFGTGNPAVVMAGPGTLSGLVAARLDVMGTVTLSGDLQSFGELYVAGGTLDLDGHRVRSFSTVATSAGGRLIMDDAASTIDGSWMQIFEGAGTSVLSAGEIRLRRALEVLDPDVGGTAFHPTGSHRVTFLAEPNSTIFVSLAASHRNGNRLHHVVVEDQARVQSHTPLWVTGQLDVRGNGGFQAPDLSVDRLPIAGPGYQVGVTHLRTSDALDADLTLQALFVGEFDPVFAPGAATPAVTLDLNGHALTVTALEVRHGGRIEMDQPSDVLSSTHAIFDFDAGVSLLSAGELRLTGQLLASGGESDSQVFHPTGSHTVVFRGPSPHIVSFGTSRRGAKRLHNAVVEDGASVDVGFPLWISGRLELQGNAFISAQELNVDRMPLTGPGYQVQITNLRASDALVADTRHLRTLNVGESDPVGAPGSETPGVTLDLNGHELAATQIFFFVGGRMEMDQPGDLIDARDLFVAGPTEPSVLSAGEIRLTGNLTALTGGFEYPVFPASGTHRVVLHGNGAQQVSISYSHRDANRLRSLVIEDGARADLFESLWVTGRVELRGDASVLQGSELNVDAMPITGAGYHVTATRLRASTALDRDTDFLGSLSIGQPDPRTPGVSTPAITLDLNGHQLGMSEDLQVFRGGRIVMDQAGDRLRAGDAVLDSTAGVSVLGAGELSLGGDLRVELGGGVPVIQGVTAAHRLRFRGNAAHHWVSPAGMVWGTIELDPVAHVMHTGEVVALGSLVVQAGMPNFARVSGTDRITVTGLDVNGLDVQGAPIVVDASAGGPLALANAGFSGNGFEPNLTIAHPGAATPFEFTGLHFSPYTTGSSARYVSATDSDGVGPFLELVIGNDPGNGAPQTDTAGGAAVTWVGP